MPFYLICSPPEPFLAVIVTPFSLLNFLPLFLKFREFVGEFVSLTNKLSHLREEDDIGEIGSAILMIVVEISIRIHIGIHSR